ncbi:MAG: hypothetical protein PHW73_05935 [Atribacterota bacterium]|nr:hypothetical protein [Atribacterota bacterium]
MTKTCKELPDYEDQETEIPLEDIFWLSDHDYDEIKVPRIYFNMVLQRLAIIKRLAKNHLAKADIPTTKMYLYQGFTPKSGKKKLTILTR